jgi:hypothetical protein
MAAIRKRGKFYYFRGTIPARQADGTIVRIRHEESLKTVSRSDATKRAADIERHYWNTAYNPPKPPRLTFAQAALTYIETKQKSDKAGWSLKEVADAGGWKTIGVVASRYIHLEKQDIQQRVEELGNRWAEGRGAAIKTAETKDD